MTEPGVPGGVDDTVELPCGQLVSPREIDLGIREFDCDCGAGHAVVMDVNPLGRFVPESVVEMLREVVDTADEFESFTTAHVMGMVVEEFPEQAVSVDVSDDGSVGYALLWVTGFDARRLHEVVVELLVELMEHAIGHADDGSALTDFERRMQEFDVDEFVDQYREAREFETEHDTAL